MKTKNLIFIYALMIFTLLLSACAPAPAAAPSPSMSVAPAAPGSAMPQGFSNAQKESADEAMAPAAAPAASTGSQSGLDNASDVKRIVIKNATLSIIVKDPAASMDSIAKMAEGMGGYIVNSNIHKIQTRDGLEVPQAEISIRVPAEQLTEAVRLIKAQVSDLSTGVTVEQITGSDVTKEYTDLKSRLTNLENAADQLREIMAKAYKTEDVMSVYNQLMQVNEQIEVIKGQIKYYDEASSLSQISVTLQSEASVQPITVGGWKPEGIARDAIQTLITTLQVLANVAIWLVLYFLPLALIFGIVILVAFLIIRAIIKAFKRPQKPQAPPSA